MAFKDEETDKIRAAVHKAAEWCAKIQGQERDGHALAQLTFELYRILDANEARARSVQVSIALPDLPKEVCQGLLEIGFDTALSAVVPQLAGVRLSNADYSGCESGSGMLSWHPPENPFRRASTTVKEPETCRACKHSLAADGMCHSIGCRCDCTRGCDCRADDVAQGIHFNECTTDRPWKKVKHVGVAEHGPTPEKVPVIFSGPHCTCGYDHGDLGSDGLCVRCGGQVSP